MVIVHIYYVYDLKSIVYNYFIWFSSNFLIWIIKLILFLNNWPIFNNDNQIEPLVSRPQKLCFQKCFNFFDFLIEFRNELPFYISYLYIYFQLFHPRERLENPTAQNLIFDQIVQDVYNPGCMRVSKDDRIKMRGMLGKSLAGFIPIYTTNISPDWPPLKRLATCCDTSCKNTVLQENILSKHFFNFFYNSSKTIS